MIPPVNRSSTMSPSYESKSHSSKKQAPMKGKQGKKKEKPLTMLDRLTASQVALEKQ